jgi:cytochrome c-type biogenesis protein CcmH
MWAVFIVAAALVAAAAFWVLRAYRDANPNAAPSPALIVCALVAIGSIGLYLSIGKPNLPDLPYKARLEALRHRDPTTYTFDEAVAVLDEAGRQNPSDARPHVFLGQLYLPREPDKAAREFDAALRRDPSSVDAMMGLGRALVSSNAGRVPPEALGLFEHVSRVSADPAPWIYQAMAAMQTNRGDDARHFWGEALTRMSANDPRRAMAAQMSRSQ